MKGLTRWVLLFVCVFLAAPAPASAITVIRKATGTAGAETDPTIDQTGVSTWSLFRWNATTSKMEPIVGLTADDDGDVTGKSFATTPSDGNNKLTLSNNTAASPTAATNEIYPDGNIWKLNENGTEYTLARVATGQDGQIYDRIVATFDGGGAEIADAKKVYVYVPFACTIVGAYAIADQSGSIVVDVWKQAWADYPPEDANTITAAAPVTITTATNSADTTLTGWTTALAAGDVIAFNVDSCTTIQWASVTLKVRR